MPCWPDSARRRWPGLVGAGHNLNCLPAHLVGVDLSTDAGQANAGPANLPGQQPERLPARPLSEVVSEVFGATDWAVTGSGRGAESVVASLVTPGSRVMANEVYVSAQWWFERFGATVEPFPVVGGPVEPEPAMLVITAPRARLGPSTGRPVALSEIRAAGAWLKTHAYNTPLVADASRLVENSAAAGTTVAEFLAEADIVVMSARKDAGCQAGGLVVSRRGQWWPRLKAAADVLESADGGLSGREMTALAQGLDRAVRGTSVANRRAVVDSLARRLRADGFNVASWGAGSIIFDAAHWLPFVPPDQLPAQVLLNVIYLLTGIRGIGTPAEEADAPQVVRVAVRDAALLIQRSVEEIAVVSAAMTSGLLVKSRIRHPPFRCPAEPADHCHWPADHFPLPHRDEESGWLVARTHAGRGPQRALVEAWGRLLPGARLQTDDLVLRRLQRLLAVSSSNKAAATIRAGRLPALRALLAGRQPGDLVVVDIGTPARWPAVARTASGVDALWASGDEGALLALPATSPLAEPVAAGALFTMGVWLEPWTGPPERGVGRGCPTGSPALAQRIFSGS